MAPLSTSLAAQPLHLQHLYATELPELCVAWPPARAPRPVLQAFNHALAHELGWPAEALDSPAGAELFSGNAVPEGAQPVAQGYAGHQFGGYNPQLGDGRALLLGEVRNAAGQLRDVAFKGSGRTPFSRGGDGKAALAPMLREYLVSEAMHALGVPTTRSLAVAITGERIRRDSGLVPAAVLTRVAASHIRVGTFQWVAGQGDTDMLRRLADHTLARHYPELAPAAYLDLLAAVCERQAALVAQWMGLGFVHGVMNTDNMTLSGETIDYGPCAFMEAYDPDTVFSSIDHGGRYAWGNQPGMAQWNLARLAEALLPLLHPDTEQAVALASDTINRFAPQYQRHWLAVMRAKLGLQPQAQAQASDAEDLALIHGWLTALQGQGADWTLAHRRLCDVAEVAEVAMPRPCAMEGEPAHPEGLEGLERLVAAPNGAAPAVPNAPATPAAPTTPATPAAAGHFAHQRLTQLCADPTALNAWLPRWQARLQRNPSGQPSDWAAAMRLSNPVVTPRNQPLEEALSAASDDGNLAPFHALLAAVQRPFDEVPGQERYASPAHPDLARGYHTFCGT